MMTLLAVLLSMAGIVAMIAGLVTVFLDRGIGLVLIFGGLFFWIFFGIAASNGVS